MPIYEYECEKCGHVEEAWQKISDPPLAECPQCHGHLKKLMSMNSFHLKGSGWYVTDYANKHGASASHTASGSSDSGSNAAGKGKAKDKSPDSSAKPSGTPEKSSKD